MIDATVAAADADLEQASEGCMSEQIPSMNGNEVATASTSALKQHVQNKLLLGCHENEGDSKLSKDETHNDERRRHAQELWTELADLRGEKLRWLKRMEQLMEENQRHAEESRRALEEKELLFAEVQRLNAMNIPKLPQEEESSEATSKDNEAAVLKYEDILASSEQGEDIPRDKVRDLCAMVKSLSDEKQKWMQRMDQLVAEHQRTLKQTRYTHLHSHACNTCTCRFSSRQAHAGCKQSHVAGCCDVHRGLCVAICTAATCILAICEAPRPPSLRSPMRTLVLFILDFATPLCLKISAQMRTCACTYAHNTF